MALTEDGLEVERQPEILEQLVADERENIDPNINTRDDEALGQINNIFSLKIAELNQVIQAGFDNLNVDLAEGIWLDKKGREKFITRQQDSFSFTNFQRFTADNGTVVPVDTLVRSTVSGDEYAVTDEVTIDATACIQTTFSVNTVANSTDYTITVNTTAYTYTSDADATESEILNGLKALIDADSEATWTATVSGSTIIIDNSVTTTTISCSSTPNMTIDSVAGYGTIQATVVGALTSVANSITELVASVPGVLSTTNDQDVVIGRLRETDVEYRARIITSNSPRSVATLDAIYSRLLNVAGVSDVSVEENPDPTTDGDGRPPYSYECVVSGGTDADVAQEIWDTKPAGKKLFGNQTVLITDAQGNERSINFSRPVGINIAFQVTYTTYDEEELPTDVDTAIRDAILDYIGTIGEDVIPQRYSAPIYNNTTGIATMTVEAQTLTNPGDTPVPGSWSTATIPIAANEFASTISGDIYIVAT